ncbi:hypothetical protein [Nocardiopsis sp. MG754419]|uniref:hypothetical protein n=1 Tax=Nocardiopsis sp. MG754419 TaxID=2259865 RepID=UPI001BA98E94|nr:hypothetical protein [Nocardiopsis sp. MG754419]MBR8744871.1 hypothetical protein [Nocardiopsis sp. MG754419]
MRFAFVHDGTGSTHSTGDTPRIGEQKDRHPERTLRPSIRIAVAAERMRDRGTTDVRRTQACLDRMWHTISVSRMPQGPAPLLDWTSDEIGEEEVFRPQAFRAQAWGART